MPNSKPVSIHYRSVVEARKTLGASSLHQVLTAAFERRFEGNKVGERWASRAWQTSTDEKEVLATNYLQRNKNYIFGELLAFTKDRAQPYVEDKGGQEILQIEQIGPGKNQSFVDGILYWFVVGDHVLFASLDRLSPRELERYLKWLLVERTSMLEDKKEILLYDGIDQRHDLLDAGSEIKTIKLSGLTELKPEALDERPARKQETAIDVIKKGGEWARRVIAAAVGHDEKTIKRIEEAIPGNAELKVVLSVGFEAYAKVDKREALRRFAIATRNLPDADLSFQTKSGEEVSRDKVRISKKRTVRLVHSVPDPNSVEEAMVEVYSSLVKDRLIR